MLPNQSPYFGPLYTDQDVNGLLDEISRLQEGRRFLWRENKRMIMLFRSMQTQILRLKSANKSLSKQLP